MPSWPACLLRTTLVAAAVGAAVLPARADPTAGDILRRPVAPYGTDYLSGLTDGISWVNAKKGGEPLFCPPRSVSIMPAQYREILRRKVETDPALAGAHAAMSCSWPWSTPSPAR